MKTRIYTLVPAVLISLCLGAQLQVTSVRKISPNGVQPQMSRDGQHVVLQDAGVAGLSVIDINSGEKHVVVKDNDVAGDVTLSDGGTMVVYRSARYVNGERYNDIKAVNRTNGEVKTLDRDGRERYAYRFAGGRLYIAKRTSVKSQRLVTDIRPVAHAYVLATEEDDLVLYDGAKRRVLNPNGPNIYLWASISPDEQHIAYMAVNDVCHTYVCDMQGKNVVDLGYYIGAPTWYNNEYLIGQQDQDDGHRMTSSRLVAVKIDGSGFQELPTPDQSMPINPSASPGRVVFENEGQIYLMELH